jgi:ATP-dependent RNA helicase DHX37/DHR1
MPKARKRSESTLHLNESSRGKVVNDTVAELGLAVPMPSVLTATRANRKQDRVAVKKERTQRIKAAMSSLEARAEEIAEHKRFVEKERFEEKQEARTRKLQLQAEHIKARRSRDETLEQRDKELRERQAVIVAEQLETMRKREKGERREARKYFKRMEAQAAVQPDAVHIPVKRTPEIQATRDSLPVTSEEQPIMDAVENARGNGVIVCGETGSGKTTQIPQFLWEAGYGHPEGASAYRDGMIVVTEPRRVAAVNMAKRVAEELGEEFGDTVCYHVRYQNNLSERCKLKFVTEGILLKEMQSDFMLRRYSAVVVDEAHERSVACDVLVGLLSRIVPLRQSLYEETRGEIKPLKLIVMSATLRVADFRDNLRLFPHPPPLIEVAVRRFPVTTHFARKTEVFRYVDAAYDKVRQIHKKLPPGGILVFLATQREIDSLCSRLADHYKKTRIVYDGERYSKHSALASRREGNAKKEKVRPIDKNSDDERSDDEDSEDEFGLAKRDYALDGDEDAPAADGAKEEGFAGSTGLADDFDYGTMRNIAGDTDSDDDEKHAARAVQRVAELAKQRKDAVAKEAAGSSRWAADDEDSWGDDDNVDGAGGGDDAEGPDGEDEEAAEGGNASDDDLDEEGAQRDVADEEDEPDGDFDTLHILPLYSLLDQAAQQRVFEAPPKGTRLCVIATNIAETSITIPNVKYVVDTGRVKNKVLQKDTQAQAFKIEWISQAAAEQRSGRAGRVGPGHCYRLFSTAVYANIMQKHTDPEIARTPLESVVLMMKHLRIDHVGNFPFPAPPEPHLIKQALIHLRRLGALDEAYRCTPTGAALASLPVTPRYGRIILEAVKRFGKKAPQVVAAVLSITSVATSTMDVFALGGDAHPPKALLHPGSDFVTFLRVFNAFAADSSLEFCRRVGIVHKTLGECAALRRQIEALVADVVHEAVTPATSGAAAAAAKGADEGTAILADFDSNEVMALSKAPQASTAAAHADERSAPKHRAEATEDVTAAAAQPSGPVDVEVAIARQQKHSRTTEELVVPPLAREEEVAMRRLFIVGLIDQVCRRATVSECKDAGVPYDVNKTTKTPYWDCERSCITYVHPASSVAQTYPAPEWVVYAVLQRATRETKAKPNVRDAGGKVAPAQYKLLMRGITVVTKQWLMDAGFVEDQAAEAIGASV